MAETLLAFDYGLRHIGVACGQTVTHSASALTVLTARDGVPDWTAVAKLLAEWRPTRLLVGLPLNMDNSESELSRRARKFAGRLHGRFGLPVELVDERLSSFAAKGEAMAQGHGRDYGKQPVDAMAARIILETWLNGQNIRPRS